MLTAASKSAYRYYYFSFTGYYARKAFSGCADVLMSGK